MPTARAMSSICASATPRSSKSVRVAPRMAVSRARRRAAVVLRRVGGASVVLGMPASYGRATVSCTRVTTRRGDPCRRQGATAVETGGMKVWGYVVIAVLAVGLLVTSIGWYLSAHPGGERFESCHWEGDALVLGYTYGTGDTVSTMVHP